MVISLFIIQVIDGKVVNIVKVMNDITMDNIKLINEIPAYVQKEGYNGFLSYNDEKGIHWDYTEIPKVDESILTLEEKAAAYDILVGNISTETNPDEVNTDEGGEV